MRDHKNPNANRLSNLGPHESTKIQQSTGVSDRLRYLGHLSQFRTLWELWKRLTSHIRYMFIQKKYVVSEKFKISNNGFGNLWLCFSPFFDCYKLCKACYLWAEVTVTLIRRNQLTHWNYIHRPSGISRLECLTCKYSAEAVMESLGKSLTCQLMLVH